MKILAIEKEVAGASWDHADRLLAREAQHVYQLYMSGALREIYFTEDKNAVLILETVDLQAAASLLSTLPLVQANMIKFDLSELRPYAGFERILKQNEQ